MKIILDFQGMQTMSRFRGIGNYSNSLAKALIKRASKNGHSIRLLLNSDFPEGVEDIKKSFAEEIDSSDILIWKSPRIEGGSKWKIKAAELVRERYIESLKPDIVHIASFFETNAIASIGRYWPDVITAVTLHDLIPYIYSEVYLPNIEERKFYIDRLENLKNADLLLAISESVRQEALGTDILKNNNIVTISSDVNEGFRLLRVNPIKQLEIKKKYQISSQFIMCVSAWLGDWRKNINNLIRAYALLEADLRKKHQLVLVGEGDRVHLEQIKNLKKELGLGESEVVLTGYIDFKDLVILYNLAKLFVFPSLHEGFGLPILEAMRCGAPVIASNRSSFPEIIGLKEALFDPLSPVDMAMKMKRVLLEKDFYNSLILNSSVQKKMYSWERSAKNALDAFELLYDIKQQKKKIQVAINREEKDFIFNKFGVDGFVLGRFIGATQKIKELPRDENEIRSVVNALIENESVNRKVGNLDLVFHAQVGGKDVGYYYRRIIEALEEKKVYNIIIQNDGVERLENVEGVYRGSDNSPCIRVFEGDSSKIAKNDYDINIALILEDEGISEFFVEKLNNDYAGVIVGMVSLKRKLIDLGLERAIQVIEEKFWRNEVYNGAFDGVYVGEVIVNFCNGIAFSSLNNKSKLEKKVRLGWITSWGTRCGIAEYSAFLLNEFDKENVDIVIYKCSEGVIDSDKENKKIKNCEKDKDCDFYYAFPVTEVFDDKIDIVVIQYNFGFIDFEKLMKDLVFIIQEGIKVIIVFHNVINLCDYDLEIILLLKMCTRIFVHTSASVTLLNQYGVVDNVVYLPQGVMNNLHNKILMQNKNFSESKNLVIGSYGFFLPPKGIYKLIEAFGKILSRFPESRLILINAEYPQVISHEEIIRCMNRAKELDIFHLIEWHTDFKTNEESLAKMRECDILVFPYQQTNEASSAAARLGLASGRPVLTTPIPIFDEVKHVTYQFKGIEADHIEEGILNFISNIKEHKKLMIQQRKWLLDHDWKRIARRIKGIIRGLVINSEVKEEVVHLSSG
ncbi:MAG: hypothetical protein C5B43_05070 [Verrucomicrobia bacterium]|nr:MAG: hypothetical protein C5B43_05070 [Verrucomicrobiota bacterium]